MRIPLQYFYQIYVYLERRTHRTPLSMSMLLSFKIRVKVQPCTNEILSYYSSKNGDG